MAPAFNSFAIMNEVLFIRHGKAVDMLPVYLSQDLNYIQDGVLNCAPVYERVLSVFDGEAMVADQVEDVDWSLLLPRQVLVNRISRLLGNPGVETPLSSNSFSPLSIVPILEPVEDGSRWRALLVDLGKRRGLAHLEDGDNTKQAFFACLKAKFCADFTAETGVECAPLTGDPKFAEVDAFFRNAIESDRNLFRRAGQIMCAPCLVSPEVNEILAKTEPALRKSSLRKTLISVAGQSAVSSAPSAPQPKL